MNNLKAFYFKYPLKLLLLYFFVFMGFATESPSQNYFQQEVNYKIEVRLNDEVHELIAFETIEYINNSPDSLRFLFFHLWPNAYSNNNTALARELMNINGKSRLFNEPELNGYIDSLDFKINNQKVNWNLLPGQPDICQIWLTENMGYGDTIRITTPFHVKVPKGVISRLGHIGESYQISQWYPKPAVYDRSGWHQMTYQDQGEFYSEFGSFDVSITLPANYIVGATGNLQNIEELKMLDKLAADTIWKNNIGYRRDSVLTSSKQFKTLRYTESRIHDFAWFADKEFHVQKGKVKLPESGREVTTWVMFANQQAELWKSALGYVNNSIEAFSKWLGDYPYQNFTAVQSALNAGEGMEYPGVAVISLTDDAYSLDEVIAHEVGHSWFYSAIGSNERKYPYMDEGITSAYEVRYMKERYPNKKLWEVYLRNRKLAAFFHINKMPIERMSEIEWLILSRNNLELPINLQASEYSTLDYETFIYNKAALGFNYLRAYLGDSLFDSAMHEYYRIWKNRHPQPEDICNVFESCTGKDLTWFFKDFISTSKRVDYRIVNYANQQVLIENAGELESPLIIAGVDKDSIYFEKWISGFHGQQLIEIPPGSYSEIKIDPKHLMPEIFRLNNNIRKKGICRKADPYVFQYFYTIEDPDKKYILYMPSLNWTKEDGLMGGMLLHNGLLLPKPFEYLIMPFYTIKNGSMAGYGKITFNIIPYERTIRLATLSLEGTKFGAPGSQDYYKARFGLDFYLNAHKVNNPLKQKVYGYYVAVSDLYQLEQYEKANINSYLLFGYLLEKPGLINPFSLLTSVELNKSFQKSTIELNYKLSYNGKNKGLDIRVFAGAMLKNTTKVPFHAISVNGRSGRDLYLYQGFYPDRFSVYPENFWSKQMTITEGGLVSCINSTNGYSQWLISASFTSSLPGIPQWVPIKPFITFLLNDHALSPNQSSVLIYETGLKAGMWNFFEIYLPVYGSRSIGPFNGSIKNRIRFILNLGTFNPLKLKTRIL